MKILNRNRIGLFLLPLFVLISCGSGSTPSFDPVLAEKLKQSLDNSVAELQIPGAVMAVRAPNGATWSAASGYAVVAGASGPAAAGVAIGNTLMTTGMHFHIASTTKSVTATIILRLVDERKIGLDDTLNQIVARWFAPGYIDFTIPYGDTITLRNILQMRSGMVDYLSTPAGAAMFAEHPLEKIDPKEMLKVAAESVDPAPYPPDTRMEYCNTNFVWQGVITQQVTGNSYTDEAAARIFVPLGLTETSVPDSPAMPSPYAHGYLPADGGVADMTESFDPSYGWSAGAIVSTVGDLLKWVTALNDGSLLSAATQEQRMEMEAGVIETWPVLYGLGIYSDNGAVGHYGNYAQFYASYPMRYNGYDFAVLSNGQLVAHTEPGWHAARLIFWNAVRDAGIQQ